MASKTLLSSLLLPLLLPLLASSSSSYPYGHVSFHIDCGSAANSTDAFGTAWLSDRFFSGSGSPAVVSQPLLFSYPPEKTLRSFPPLSSGKKNCYAVPGLPSGRYYVRAFTVYDDYDGRSHPPSFDASVQGTLVFSWRSPWPEHVARLGAYSDLLAFVPDREAEICFYSIATDAPVVGSLSLVQVDPLSYDAASIGVGFILVNYGRLDCGSGQWGPGFSNDTDYFGRSWQSDHDFRSPDSQNNAVVISTNSTIAGANQQPNYFPMKLYQTAIMAREGSLGYELEVDAKMDYLLWLHFAEIESKVSGAGQRVFDVKVNEVNLTRVDIYKEVGLFAAYDWHCTVKNLSSTTLSVTLEPVVGVPLISGLENYALVPVDLSTDSEQVAAMRALKESFGVPERMGWNGDPCAPTSWDAWEGVTCHPNKDKTSLVIYEIDLGSQGLKGYLSDQINLLSNLVSLNLSSNSLRGTIPSGLGENALARLDLSGNQLTGFIPDSLASSNMQLVLLNDNLLEGQVPEGLYSIGVHGGSIDISGNKALCGAPSLPACSLLWENGGLSSGAKIAIGLSCAVTFIVLLVVLLVFCIRRRRSDYDFGLPQELMSLAGKRNRYQRQKSLMLLEMESQHAKGLPSPFSPNYQKS
ncbi:receptor-like protein 4 [Syzygium oleosum]|uniref:receptor-like protein 4 n=1 Tax=Syzygium oleosum TaxID=219896 RepID=UPI0011D2A449|nr:receptor-like protein 4 [Syzygium oleosum]